MLHRQKALLLILQQAGGIVSNRQLMKWAFLLANETSSRGGKTFYNFLPYKDGPYSFTLDREMDSLIRNGFVKKVDDNLCQLTHCGKQLNINLTKNIINDITYIFDCYGKLSADLLTNSIYNRYSWFTINSKLPEERKEERPFAEKCIYTAGYEKKTVDEFLNILIKSGISRLIDVRYNPISRRYGFHKSTLSRLCNSLNIDYQHLPNLGIPGSERENLECNCGYASLFDKYRSNLPSYQEDIVNIIQLIRSQPSVLVCMEADPRFCHRNVLAEYLVNLIDMPIKHLGCNP